MVTHYYCFKFENQFENFSLYLYPNISLHILHTVLDTFGTDKESLFNNQDLQLVIYHFLYRREPIFDSGMILNGGIKCKFAQL